MKIYKALEILDDLLGEGPQYPPDDRRDAVKLGIEALREVKKARDAGGVLQCFTLLNETEDK